MHIGSKHVLKHRESKTNVKSNAADLQPHFHLAETFQRLQKGNNLKIPVALHGKWDECQNLADVFGQVSTDSSERLPESRAGSSPQTLQTGYAPMCS